MQPRVTRALVSAAAVVLLALLALHFTATPTAIDVFFQQPTAPPATPPDSATAAATDSLADAGGVIAIRVDVETDVTPLDVSPPPPPAPREEPAPPPDEESTPMGDLDVDDLLDHAGAPRGGGSSAPVDAIPPRPVEITWPDTRRLKACIGQSVEVRVLVGDDGRVLDVRGPAGSPAGPACIAAAVETARRIRFEPGRVAGLPATLWTQVRIDFEKKK